MYLHVPRAPPARPLVHLQGRSGIGFRVQELARLRDTHVLQPRLVGPPVDLEETHATRGVRRGDQLALAFGKCQGLSLESLREDLPDDSRGLRPGVANGRRREIAQAGRLGGGLVCTSSPSAGRRCHPQGSWSWWSPCSGPAMPSGSLPSCRRCGSRSRYPQPRTGGHMRSPEQPLAGTELPRTGVQRQATPSAVCE